MELYNNQVYLTEREQAALDTPVNPIPAGILYEVWSRALDEATAHEEQLEIERGEVDGSGWTIDGNPAWQAATFNLRQARIRRERLENMRNVVAGIAMGTM